MGESPKFLGFQKCDKRANKESDPVIVKLPKSSLLLTIAYVSCLALRAIPRVAAVFAIGNHFVR